MGKDQPFICAECGKPLVEVKSPAAFWLRYAYGVLGVIVVAGIAFATVPQLRGLIVKHSEHHEPGERPRSSDSSSTPDNPPPSGDNPPGPTSGVTPSGDGTSSAPPADVPKFAHSPDRLNLDLTNQENKQVKADVLTRIDQMPKISGDNKDKLYMAVERARSMGKILTIPFSSGKTDLSATDVDAMKTELDKEGLKKLRDDPTAVFVILGYADPKGDVNKNIAISQQRAEAVLKAMRDKCGVINVMHTVGMGGSKLQDAQNLDKNRTVEIWAVLP